MSVCQTSDDEGSNKSEGLLTERKLCAECGFEASDEDLLDKHLEEHTKQTCNTLNEEVTTVPKVKPLPLHKCSKCSFITTTIGALKDHKNTEHDKGKSLMN